VWTEHGERVLSIPNVRDRVVQAAATDVMAPICEEVFLDCSHGFRQKRGCGTALGAVRDALESGGCWVLTGDVAGCFDNVRRRRLVEMVVRHLPDRTVDWLLERIVWSATPVDDVAWEDCPGISQGGPLSPLPGRYGQGDVGGTCQLCEVCR